MRQVNVALSPGKALQLLAASLLLLIAQGDRAVMAAGDEQNIKAQFEQAYTRLLADPSNRELNLNYAAMAMQMQDFEAAISPLERILMNEPKNAKIRLQIGILYNSLGSKMIARQYFEEVLATPGAPEAVVEEAKGHLNAI